MQIFFNKLQITLDFLKASYETDLARYEALNNPACAMSVEGCKKLVAATDMYKDYLTSLFSKMTAAQIINMSNGLPSTGTMDGIFHKNAERM